MVLLSNIKRVKRRILVFIKPAEIKKRYSITIGFFKSECKCWLPIAFFPDSSILSGPVLRYLACMRGTQSCFIKENLVKKG